MPKYISEKYQLGIVTHFLREEGIEYTTEASIYSSQIDIIGLKRESTIAIELKSKDVTRGISQAERNCHLVDYSFLAMWEENISENTIDRISDSTIGLLSVGDKVQCLSPPTLCEANKYAKSRVKKCVLDDF